MSIFDTHAAVLSSSAKTFRVFSVWDPEVREFVELDSGSPVTKAAASLQGYDVGRYGRGAYGIGYPASESFA